MEGNYEIYIGSNHLKNGFVYQNSCDEYINHSNQNNIERVIKNKKSTKNPFDYLNNALYFYYNQNPNFNPFIKIHASPKKFIYNNTYGFNQKYDLCSSYYYVISNRIRRCRKFPKVKKTNYWIKKNGGS
jgi:hypothetical protein